MSDQLKFYKGVEANLPKSGIEVGALYHCTDTKNTYLGTSATTTQLFSTAMPKENYVLGPCYNYAGHLIEIGPAATLGNSTMVVIQITGNSYNYAGEAPINSLFQFYDYGGNPSDKRSEFLNWSGLHLGYNIGDMTIYRADNKLYAYIAKKSDYQTLNFTLYTNKKNLIPTVLNQESMHAESDMTVVGQTDTYGNIIGPGYKMKVIHPKSNIINGRDIIVADNKATTLGNLTGTWANQATGEYSLAGGYNSYAQGDIAFSFGHTNDANGECAAVFGYSNAADGNYSFASGHESRAQGVGSTAMGHTVIAGCKAYYVIAIDKDSHCFYISDTWSGDNPIWVSKGDATYYNATFQSEYEISNDPTATSNRFSISANSYFHWVFAGGITSIQGNRVTYDDKDNTLDGHEKWIDNLIRKDNPTKTIKMHFYIPSQPLIGSTSVGIGSFATGWYSQALGEHSFAAGCSTQALGRYGCAVGNGTVAGFAGFAEGVGSQALGLDAHAGGEGSIAKGNHSFAQGFYVKALGTASVAEGSGSIAEGNYSHAEGADTQATGVHSHAQGSNTIASNQQAHAGGRFAEARGITSFAHGRATTEYTDSAGKKYTNEADRTIAYGEGSVAMGVGSQAKGHYTTALGYKAIAGKLTTNNKPSGDGAVALGFEAQATSKGSTALGYGTQATQSGTTAVGDHSEATGYNAFAGGYYTESNGGGAFAYGRPSDSSTATKITETKTKAVGISAIALGTQAQATSDYAVAIGLKTTASKSSAIALGSNAQATGIGSIAINGTASEDNMIAIGNSSTGTFQLKGTTIKIQGPTTLSSTLSVTGATTLKNGLNVTNSKATTLSGTLNVTGTTTLKDTLSATSGTFSGALTVADKATLNNGLEVSSNSTTSPALKVSSGSTSLQALTATSGTFNSNVTVTGTTTLSGVVKINGGMEWPTGKDIKCIGDGDNCDWSINLQPTKTTSTSKFLIYSNTQGKPILSCWNNNLNVKVHHKLEIGDSTTINNEVLKVNGNTSLNNTLKVAGTTTLTGATSISSTLSVDGATTLKNGLEVTNSKATTLSGTLNVTGATTLSDALSVTKKATLKNGLEVSSGNTSLQVLSATNGTFSGTLGVTGATTLSSTLTTNGKATLKNGLEVTNGATTLKALTATGTTKLSSTLDVTGKATFSDKVSIQKGMQWQCDTDITCQGEGKDWSINLSPDNGAKDTRFLVYSNTYNQSILSCWNDDRTVEAHGKMIVNGKLVIKGTGIEGGWESQASGYRSFAYGSNATANGSYSFAYGRSPTANTFGAFAIGDENCVQDDPNRGKWGWNSFAAGAGNVITDVNAFALGRKLLSINSNGGVIGQYNDPTSRDVSSSTINRVLLAGGNGTSAGRSNAFLLFMNGDAKFAGDVSVSRLAASDEIQSAELTATNRVSTALIDAKKIVTSSYGSEEDMNKVDSPKAGQIFFVEA